MPKRLIPLESVDGPAPDGPTPLTDVVLAFFLEGIARDPDQDEDETLFEAKPLREAATGAFALGCAVGVEFPKRVDAILRQTHGEDIPNILAECREPLAEQVKEARETGGQVAPELFLGSLFDALEDTGSVEADTAYNILSISFEYGVILTTVDRAASIVVRNAYNRRLREMLKALEEGQPIEVPPGVDPSQSLQEFAKELVTAYEQDIGFGGPSAS
ncbi:MAG: hypothetical protein FJ318_04970 [SAR202 cluster bacterium]|nr:hypothetical protein [SAR202 cluster bacterium]